MERCPWWIMTVKVSLQIRSRFRVVLELLALDTSGLGGDGQDDVSPGVHALRVRVDRALPGGDERPLGPVLVVQGQAQRPYVDLGGVPIGVCRVGVEQRFPDAVHRNGLAHAEKGDVRLQLLEIGGRDRRLRLLAARAGCERHDGQNQGSEPAPPILGAIVSRLRRHGLAQSPRDRSATGRAERRLRCRRGRRIAERRACFDERREERVGSVRPALELGVELARHEPWVIRELDHLHEPAVGRHPADAQTVFFQRLSVGVVDLVAVPVPLPDLGGAVDGSDPRSLLEAWRATRRGAWSRPWS